MGISQEKREKEEEKRKKGKELTSSSRGTGDVRIGKSGEPLGLPFSRVLNIRLFLISFSIIAPKSWQ